MRFQRFLVSLVISTVVASATPSPQNAWGQRDYVIEELVDNKWEPFRNPTIACRAELTGEEDFRQLVLRFVDDYGTRSYPLKHVGKTGEGRKLTTDKLADLLNTPRTVLCGVEPDEQCKSVLSPDAIWIDVPNLHVGVTYPQPPLFTLQTIEDSDGQRFEIRGRPRKLAAPERTMRYLEERRGKLTPGADFKSSLTKLEYGDETRFVVTPNYLEIRTVDGHLVDANSMLATAKNPVAVILSVGEISKSWRSLLKGDALVVRIRQPIKVESIGKPHKDTGRLKRHNVDQLGLDAQGRLFGRYDFLMNRNTPQDMPGSHRMQTEMISETSCRLKLSVKGEKGETEYYIGWPTNINDDRPVLFAEPNEQCVWHIWEYVTDTHKTDGSIRVNQGYIPAIKERDDQCLQMSPDGTVLLRHLGNTTQLPPIEQMFQPDYRYSYSLRSSTEKFDIVKTQKVYDDLRDGR
jgi:hypothetical protein